MLYREITAICSQIHTKHINTLCEQNVELLNVKLAVHIVAAALQRVKPVSCWIIPYCEMWRRVVLLLKSSVQLNFLSVLLYSGTFFPEPGKLLPYYTASRSEWLIFIVTDVIT